MLCHNFTIWISLKDKFLSYTITFKLKYYWITSIIGINSIGTILCWNNIKNHTFSYFPLILISLAFILFISTVLIIQFIFKHKKNSIVYSTLLTKFVYPNMTIIFFASYDIYKLYLNIKFTNEHFIFFLSPLYLIVVSYLFLTRGYNYLLKQLPQNTLNTFKLFLGKKNISKREYDVIQHLLQGYSNKQIATKCFISNNTVKTHLANIYKKLKITKRTDLYKLLSNC